jgi:hypothetical protein
MVYTLYSHNEPRVAEIAAVDLKGYGKIGNLVLCHYISRLITEVPDLLALIRITWKAECGYP